MQKMSQISAGFNKEW